MKISNLFALGTVMVLALTGCKQKPVPTTPLDTAAPTGSGDASARKPANLNTDPLAPPPGVTGDPKSFPVNGGTLENLPDEGKLADRDLDRATFAAQTLYFDYDRANVRANEAHKINQVAAQFKSKGPTFDLLIEGHCDEQGTEEYNRALGERRALAIRELLIKSGVDGNHLFTRSFGKDKPASPEHDEVARSKNRRGEFVLVLPKKITTTQNAQ